MNIPNGTTKILIKLFIASSYETKDTRDKIRLSLGELNSIYKTTKFYFEPVVWETQSATWTERTQDEYNKLIADCQLVAVIIKNKAGKFTQEEFDVARKNFEKSGSPKVVVYTLPPEFDDKDRDKFLNSFKKEGSEYFPCVVDNSDQLIGKIKDELTRIINKFKEELSASVESAQETVERLNLNGELTREAKALFEAGDFVKANASLSIEDINKQVRKISEQDEKLKTSKIEVAEALVFKAKLELTSVTNRDRFNVAKELFEKAVGVIRAPKILFEYACFCQDQNIFKKAIALFEETLGFCRELGDKPNIAGALNNLALLHKDMGDYEKAEAEYNEALYIRCELAQDNPNVYEQDVAMTLNNLAVLHYDSGDYKKAEEEYNEALDIRRKLATDNPDVYEPDVATTLNNLGRLHYKSGDYKKAETEFNKALTIYRKFAENNPDVAMTLNNLGILHYDNGDYEIAADKYNEALTIYRKLAEDNPAVHEPKVAMMLNNLGAFYCATDNYKQAEIEYKEALEFYQKLAENNPVVYEPYVAGTLNNSALLHDDNGDYEKAEVEYNEALKFYRKFAESNPDVYMPDLAGMLNNLGALHKNSGNYKQAEGEYNEALGLLTPFYEAYPNVHGKLYDMIKQGLEELEKLTAE